MKGRCRSRSRGRINTFIFRLRPLNSLIINTLPNSLAPIPTNLQSLPHLHTPVTPSLVFRLHPIVPNTGRPSAAREPCATPSMPLLLFTHVITTSSDYSPLSHSIPTAHQVLPRPFVILLPSFSRPSAVPCTPRRRSPLPHLQSPRPDAPANFRQQLTARQAAPQMSPSTRPHDTPTSVVPASYQGSYTFKRPSAPVARRLSALGT